MNLEIRISGAILRAVLQYLRRRRLG